MECEPTWIIAPSERAFEGQYAGPSSAVATAGSCPSSSTSTVSGLCASLGRQDHDMMHEGIIAGDTHAVYRCHQVCVATQRLAAWVREDFQRWWPCASELPTLPKHAPLPALSGKCHHPREAFVMLDEIGCLELMYEAESSGHGEPPRPTDG